MSQAPQNPERQQQKISEFLRLLPLTLELAGLARAQAGATHYNQGQLEVRAITIKNAYKVARQLISEIAND